MADFTPIPALVGGALIGLSASATMLCNGRVAGISGILAGVLPPAPREWRWRAAFLAGLLLAGGVLAALRPAWFDMGVTPPRGVGALVLGGLLVGFGSRLGSGCTSGHGVCGISRLSRRSIAATCTFMATGAAAVWLLHHGLGAAP